MAHKLNTTTLENEEKKLTLDYQAFDALINK
jgi:hypothetical protein